MVDLELVDVVDLTLTEQKENYLYIMCIMIPAVVCNLCIKQCYPLLRLSRMSQDNNYVLFQYNIAAVVPTTENMALNTMIIQHSTLSLLVMVSLQMVM